MESTFALDSTLYPIIGLLFIGIAFFCLCMLTMVLLFGIATSTLLEKKPAVIALFILSMSLSLSIGGAQNTTIFESKATAQIFPENIVKKDLAKGEVLISFTTRQPAIGFLEIKTETTTIPLLPAYSLEPRMKHTIQFDANLLTQGTLYLIVNNERFIFKVD